MNSIIAPNSTPAGHTLSQCRHTRQKSISSSKVASGSSALLGLRAHQVDPPAGARGLRARELVGGAGREAQPAVDAVQRCGRDPRALAASVGCGRSPHRRADIVVDLHRGRHRTGRARGIGGLLRVGGSRPLGPRAPGLGAPARRRDARERDPGPSEAGAALRGQPAAAQVDLLRGHDDDRGRGLEARRVSSPTPACGPSSTTCAQRDGGRRRTAASPRPRRWSAAVSRRLPRRCRSAARSSLAPAPPSATAAGEEHVDTPRPTTSPVLQAGEAPHQRAARAAAAAELRRLAR